MAGAPGVAAGLQRHVGGGPPRIAAGRGEGVDLGVRLARVPMPTLSDSALAAGDHAAHPWVGVVE